MEGNTATHKALMRLAIQQADIALQMGEVPVGCVFLRPDAHRQALDTGVTEGIDVLTVGHNRTNDTHNATLHAELVATAALRDQCGSEDSLRGAVLYVTVEPCLMCGWALRLLGVSQVYYGASNPRFGGNGSVYSFHSGEGRAEGREGGNVGGCQDVGTDYESRGGVLENETIEILKRFYAQENSNAPVEKRKIKT